MTEKEKIPDQMLDNIAQEKKIGIMINEIRKDLRTNPAYKDFFSRYNSSSVERFIENYSLRKSRYLQYGEILNKNNENILLRREVEADERLWEIQRKKLFDMECRWRAELIKIPYIELTVDFEYWSKNIENCPFIEPISEDDITLYIDYLLSEDFFDFKLDYVWMSYNEIKNTLKDFGNIPPWYEYYDLHRGTGNLLYLPDIRGEKEDYYLNILRNHPARKNKSKSLPGDSRPYLQYFDLSVVEEFIKMYEDDKILRYFFLFEKELTNMNDELDQAIAILKGANEDIPIESHLKWRSAVILAAKKYEQKEIAGACRRSYNTYKYRMKIGIAQESHSSEDNKYWVRSWATQYRNKIIQARRLVQEPGDLNF